MPTDVTPPGAGEPSRETGGVGAVDAVVDAIGPRIRERRQQLGLSLQQLAARCVVSAAAIHKVERGDMVPTITTLLKIASALGRPVSYFVGEGADDEEPAHFTPASDRPVVSGGADGADLARISGPADRFRAAGTVATLAPGVSVAGRPRPRPAEYLVLVLRGSVEFEVSGLSYTLREGDALHYSADRPYRYGNPGRRPAQLVWFTSREG